MSQSHHYSARAGLLYGLAAYGLWGLVPIYFQELKPVPPAELLAFRVVFTVILMGLILTMARRWGDLVRLFKNRKTMSRMLLSTLLISINWYAFLYGVLHGKILETSLGYFIAPLVNVALGIVIFSERLRGLQWIALIFAAVGVAYRIIWMGEIPWIALTLAVSFSLYGMVRKQAGVDGILGLTVETMLLLPIAMIYLITVLNQRPLTLGLVSPWVDWMIVLSGAITAAPLILYAQAVRRLQYSTIGILQYISPSVTFVLAVTVYREPFPVELQICFACIWVGLLLFMFDSVHHLTRRRRLNRPSTIAPGPLSLPATGPNAPRT